MRIEIIGKRVALWIDDSSVPLYLDCLFSFPNMFFLPLDQHRRVERIFPAPTPPTSDESYASDIDFLDIFTPFEASEEEKRKTVFHLKFSVYMQCFPCAAGFCAIASRVKNFFFITSERLFFCDVSFPFAGGIFALISQPSCMMRQFESFID